MELDFTDFEQYLGLAEREFGGGPNDIDTFWSRHQNQMHEENPCNVLMQWITDAPNRISETYIGEFSNIFCYGSKYVTIKISISEEIAQELQPSLATTSTSESNDVFESSENLSPATTTTSETNDVLGSSEFPIIIDDEEMIIDNTPIIIVIDDED